LPPSFEELPVPSNQKINEVKQKNSIKSLITDKKISDKKIINTEADKDFEQSILDKIKNN
jgi:choline kinase